MNIVWYEFGDYRKRMRVKTPLSKYCSAQARLSNFNIIIKSKATVSACLLVLFSLVTHLIDFDEIFSKKNVFILRNFTQKLLRRTLHPSKLHTQAGGVRCGVHNINYDYSNGQKRRCYKYANVNSSDWLKLLRAKPLLGCRELTADSGQSNFRYWTSHNSQAGWDHRANSSLTNFICWVPSSSQGCC